MAAKLTPHIYSEDARTQAEFYKNALGGEILAIHTAEQMPGMPEELQNKVMHLHLVVAGGNDLLLADVFQPNNQGQSISLTVTFDTEAEARDAFTNMSAGGIVKSPFDKQQWGSYYGEVDDKFGIKWSIMTR
ncbi:VOC family protein [Paenibacillus xerothermodurans]|uniref:VOC family protein n=1 Tax=Paenibacillus xerothermodurans TaxID=1977292 RepID=A0A2W1NMC6_PAEXE|nr:VOC family protein [Paenibacillus xerothermodurans]PZE19006.1 VOC family protein [Paenibacillus xerothermodurans]